MAKTEAGVRAVIVAAIQGIYSDLGLADTSNIHSKLLSVTPTEDYDAYLSANIDGATVKKVRAVGVQVVGALEFYTTNNRQNRLYSITVQAYYDERDINDLIDGMSRIQRAIGQLNATLSNTVTWVKEASITEPNLIDLDSVGQVATMQLSISAEDNNPEFL